MNEDQVVSQLRAGPLSFHNLCNNLNVTKEKINKFQKLLRKMGKESKVTCSKEIYTLQEDLKDRVIANLTAALKRERVKTKNLEEQLHEVEFMIANPDEDTIMGLLRKIDEQTR